MYIDTKTQKSRGIVVQRVNAPHFNYGKPNPVKEVVVKKDIIYKITRVGKMHRISTLEGNVTQASGNYEYCCFWWESNVGGGE
jgi:hypothetical protein